jgi:hypothetical protein
MIRPISFSPLAPAFLDTGRSRANRAILKKPKIEISFPKETHYMPKIWIALFVMVPCLFAQGGETNCQEVGAAILTNFLPEHGTITLFRLESR